MQWLAAVLVSVIVAACGGGGGGGAGSAGGGTAASVNTSTASVSGVAAVGLPIRGRISMMDANGLDRYVDTADGNFSFKLQGLSAPVLLRAQWTDAGGLHTLYSFASAEGVANITPLTHLAVAAAVGTTALDALYNAPSAAAYDAIKRALPSAIATLQTALQPLLSRYAVQADNPITFRFVPDHTGMDAVLDNISVVYSGANVTLTDKVTGKTLLAAPLSKLTMALSTASWSSAEAAVAMATDVAISSAGTGLVVWTEMVAGGAALRARLMTGSGAVATLSSTDASAPRVAYDGAGNAVVVWVQGGNSRSEIWSSRFTAGSQQWAAARRVSDADALALASQPDIAVDATGNALVVWTQGNANHFDGWSAQYSAANDTWSAPALVTDGINSAYGLRVASNAAGAGHMAWKQERAAGFAGSAQPVDIWARSASTTGARGTSARLNTNAAGVSAAAYVIGPLALDVNAQGSAAVLWSQRAQPSLPLVVQAAMHTASSGWQAAAAISPSGTDDCYAPQVALDSAGNAMAVWQQQTDFGAYGGSNRFAAGTGWGSAYVFVDARDGDTYAPSMAMDAAGNVTLVWYRWSSNNTIDVMMIRHLPSTGWSNAQVFAPLGISATIMNTQPLVVANATGQTVVVWGGNQSAAGI
jgi:hypothetical protein